MYSQVCWLLEKVNLSVLRPPSLCHFWARGTEYGGFLFVFVCFSYLFSSFFLFGCSWAGCSLLPKHKVFRAGAGWRTEDAYSVAMDERMPIPWPWMGGCLFRGHGRPWTAMEGVLLRVSVDQTQEAHMQKYPQTELWRRSLEPYWTPLGQSSALLSVCDAFSQQRCILIPTATLEGERGSQSYAQLPDRPDGTQDDRINGRGWYSDIYKIPSY